MDELNLKSLMLGVAAFILGWIGSEMYKYYKDAKEKRWHSSPTTKWK